MEKEKIDVIFLKFAEGDVIAMFPNERETYLGDMEHYCLSYQHIGQHAPADRNLLDELPLATPDEYRSLENELKGMYELNVLKEVKKKEEKVSDKEFDEFLNEATHYLDWCWLKFSRLKLDTDELMDINDMLTRYFEDKR